MFISIKVMAFWLIENIEQLDYLKQKPIKEAFVEIIPYHDKIHPVLNEVSLVYIRPFNDTKGYMLCIDHSESFSLNKTVIDGILQNIERVWVQDKKQALYYFPIKCLHDLSQLIPPYIQDSKTHNHFYSKYPNYDKTNKIIPISKHYERCEHIYEHVRNAMPKELPSWFDFYNNKVVLAFFGIEKNGIKINKYEFDKHYELDQEFYSIKGDHIFTNYNLATTTRRPSNSFNGINFAAINKENGSRRGFISSHGFVEFDISAFHPTIIGRLLTYDFGHLDVHQAFADLYQTSYKEAKQITFKQLYGGISKEYEHLEFFQQVKEFINNNWKEFNNSGQVIVPISGYCFEKDKMENMNPQKLFNYMLQNMESAINTYILMDIHKLLMGRKTKIVLYTYDSFLFQIGEGEEDIENEIQNIFKKYKLTTKTSYGNTYDFTRN
jgi:hypothetical protein